MVSVFHYCDLRCEGTRVAWRHDAIKITRQPPPNSSTTFRAQPSAERSTQGELRFTLG